MELRDPVKVDRSKWRPGPWDTEPLDDILWSHAGFYLRMTRHPTGHWLGRIAVPREHHWAHSIYFRAYEPHGGITLVAQSKAHWGTSSRVPGPCRIIGFECSHIGDDYPGIPPDPTAHYWTMEEVRVECERLAEAAREAGPGNAMVLPWKAGYPICHGGEYAASAALCPGAMLSHATNRGDIVHVPNCECPTEVRLWHASMVNHSSKGHCWGVFPVGAGGWVAWDLDQATAEDTARRHNVELRSFVQGRTEFFVGRQT